MNAKTKISGQSNISETLSYIAQNLNNIQKIAEEVNSQTTFQVLEDHSHIPPTTPIEIRLEEIWSEYLKLNHIGINDDFFTLGGTSILLMRILSKVKKEFQVEITVKIAFDGDFTITKLSKEIVCQKLKNIDIDQLKQKMKSIESLPENQNDSFAYKEEKGGGTINGLHYI
jgi:acyl carrier protein